MKLAHTGLHLFKPEKFESSPVSSDKKKRLSKTGLMGHLVREMASVADSLRISRLLRVSMKKSNIPNFLSDQNNASRAAQMRHHYLTKKAKRKKFQNLK